MSLLIAPEYVIIWCPRSLLSLLGIIVAFMGLWRLEKRWDDLAHSDLVAGSAGNNDTEMGYRPADEQTKPGNGDAPGAIGGATATTGVLPPPQEGAANNANSPVAVAANSPAQPTPVPIVMLIGFAMWAFSFFLSPLGNRYPMQLSLFGIISTISLCAIAAVLAVPFQAATMDRNIDKKQKLSLAMIACWVVFMMSLILNASIQKFIFFPFAGVTLVVSSFYYLWKHRKMGESWDMHGTANADYVVQTLATPGLVVGLYLLWLSSNTVITQIQYDQMFLPIYCNERSMVASVAAYLIIIPMSLARDYAFDSGSKQEGISLDGSTFSRSDIPVLSVAVLGAAIEGPAFHILGWLMFGLAAFVPFYNGIEEQQFFACFACIMIVTIDVGFVQPHFWRANASVSDTVTNIWYLSLSILAVVIGVHGGIALALAAVGVVLIAFGRKTGLSDRKKGEDWLLSQTANPEAKTAVYGYGIPMFTIGMIVLTLAMSIPMN